MKHNTPYLLIIIFTLMAFSLVWIRGIELKESMDAMQMAKWNETFLMDKLYVKLNP